MGKYDDAIYRYLSDNDRFADLFNAVMFGGEKVLRGEALAPDSQRHVTVAEGRNPSDEPKGDTLAAPIMESRFRDIKKRAESGERFVITAIENQESIDYAMPWRMMQYDQMEYGEQIQALRRRKAAALREQGKTPGGWTTRLGPGDCLRPVYTICFYHGTEAWDGPRSLKDMMCFEGLEREDVWRRCFHDYGMTLFSAGETEDFSRFGTELRQLLEVLAVRKDPERLAALWNREDFAHLERETAETMAIMTDSTEVLRNLEAYEKEGDYNMCLAMDELRKSWKAEGKQEGREEGIKSIIFNMFQKGFTLEQIAEATDQDVEEIRTVLGSRTYCPQS